MTYTIDIPVQGPLRPISLGNTPPTAPEAARSCPALVDELGAVREFYRFRASLSQWRAFHAVIACGGYAGAAEFLHVTQPAVSYAVSKLEQQLNVRLLKLDGRKAQITEAGKALLERSHHLLLMAAELEHMALGLGEAGQPRDRGA